MNKEAGRKIIAERVEEFEKNKAVLTKKGHGETNIRSNYIDIMFNALGWNMKSHYEVVREYSQRDKSTDGGTKKVDYAFKINGKLKFFIEAKEASVDLEKDKAAIFQAKRYAYSSNGKAPIVILTDFEEFRVFNVIKAPLMDNTDRELLKPLTMIYTDYLEKWDLLWDTFSREAVENGSLDKLRGKIDKNTKTMDVDFLEQITSWRESLAKNIAIRNENLNVDEINEAVQRILDRLVFIRNLEDREIEPENTLLDKTKKSENIYKSIIPIFHSLNITYNGLLFKKHFSEDIEVDDKTIKDIIRQMCYPVSPFQFDVIEPEILGRIYEKFLGSKIRLTDNHRAKIEEKIEVRKAGGVYYTPEYIVEYIVQNTVGKKIEGLTPEEIKNIKILDPACGSGSFLIGAYSYLLDYHHKWYTENHKDKSYQADWYKTKDGEIKVSLDKRSDILRNNIFGVDIDKEATEVAIMSLYLKMLDDGFDKGERDLFFIKGSILPDMINNVKCGNSLVSTDFYEEKLFDDELLKKINPFNWRHEFPSVFKNGGFDVIIGNPPYIRVQELDYAFIDYCKEKYMTAWKRIDISTLFIEIANRILNENGLNGFITSNQFLSTEYGRKMRQFLLEKAQIIKMINFGDLPIFQGALTYVSIFILSKGVTEKFNYYKVENLDQDINDIELIEISNSSLNEEAWILENEGKNAILTKIKNNYNPLSMYAKCWYGIITGADDAFMFENNQLNDIDIEKEILLPIIRAQDCVRYGNSNPSKCVIYPYTDINGTTVLMDEKDLMKKYPKTYKYLKNMKSSLSSRKDSRKELGENGSWYSLVRFGKYSIFHQPKIVTPGEVKNNKFCLDETGSGYSGARVFGITAEAENVNLKVLLGILNSNLIQFYLHSVAPLKQGGYYSYSSTFIDSIPLPNEITNPNSEEIKELLVSVESLLKNNKELLTIKLESGKEQIIRKNQFLEEKVNTLVYKLYKLSDEEIKLIES